MVGLGFGLGVEGFKVEGSLGIHGSGLSGSGSLG